MTNLTSSLTIKVLADTKQAKTAAQALREIEANAKAASKAMEGSGATDRFTKSLAGLKLQAKDIDTVRKAWTDYAKSVNLAADSAKWTKQQATDVRAWERSTISALRTVKREQAAFYKAQTAAAIRAERAAGGFSPGAAAGIAGLYAGSRAKQFAGATLRTYRDYSDINAISRPVLDLSPDEQASLKSQQRDLGVKSRYSPVKIAEAQKLLGERGVAKSLIQPYVEHAINYASAMNVELPDAIKTLEAYMFSTGKLKGVTDPEKARKVMQRVTDYATHLSKISGLPDREISSFFEYGGLSGSQAGLSDETVGAIAALMKRNQISGEKAGVAMRAISAKLVSPTKKGLSALSSMGINYDDYAKLKGGLSGENVALAVQREFGQKLAQEQIDRINAMIDDPDKTLATNRGDFVQNVGEVVAEKFKRTKKGTLAAKDAQAISKTLGQMHGMASEVNAEGLLDAIAAAKATLAQLNAFFGFQQGSRAGAALSNKGELDEKRKQLAETKTGYARDIATERLNSFAGAVSRLEGSIETLQIRIAESFDDKGKGGALTGFVNALEKATNILIGLPDGLTRLGVEAGALAATLATLRGFGAITGALGGAGAAAKIGAGSAALGTAGIIGLGGLAAYEGATALDDNARHGTKESGKTYTSDVLRRLFGGSITPRADFDVGRASRIAQNRSSMPAFAQGEGASPHVNTADLAKAKIEAEGAKEAVDGLNTTVSPKVDSSSIDAFIAKVGQAKAAVAGLGTAVAGETAKVGALGKVQRGRFSYGGVQGE